MGSAAIVGLSDVHIARFCRKTLTEVLLGAQSAFSPAPIIGVAFSSNKPHEDRADPSAACAF